MDSVYLKAASKQAVIDASKAAWIRHIGRAPLKGEITDKLYPEIQKEGTNEWAGRIPDDPAYKNSLTAPELSKLQTEAQMEADGWKLKGEDPTGQKEVAVMGR